MTTYESVQRRTNQKIASKGFVQKIEIGCVRPSTCRVTDTPEIKMRRREANFRAIIWFIFSRKLRVTTVFQGSVDAEFSAGVFAQRRGKEKCVSYAQCEIDWLFFFK